MVWGGTMTDVIGGPTVSCWLHRGALSRNVGAQESESARRLTLAVKAAARGCLSGAEFSAGA